MVGASSCAWPWRLRQRDAHCIQLPCGFSVAGVGAPAGRAQRPPPRRTPPEQTSRSEFGSGRCANLVRDGSRGGAFSRLAMALGKWDVGTRGRFAARRGKLCIFSLLPLPLPRDFELKPFIPLPRPASFVLTRTSSPSGLTRICSPPPPPPRRLRPSVSPPPPQPPAVAPGPLGSCVAGPTPPQGRTGHLGSA